MLRVMTLNAHAGVNGRGAYDLPHLAEAIAKAKVDIVGLQEITRNHASYQCEDQPARLASLLQQSTGRQWSHAYKNEWVTKHRQCVDSGRGDDVETEGLALLAPEPLEGVDSVHLWNSRIGLGAHLASVPDVQFVVTHLAANVKDETANVKLQKDRTRQIETLLQWAAGRGATRILMGDFNADPQSPEMQPVLAQYHDAWTDAAAQGATAGSGETHKGSRIDYIFYTPPGGLQLERVEVVDTGSLLGGTEVSDHRPVLATFRVR